MFGSVWVAAFWEGAARSVCCVFFVCWLVVVLLISHFGFEGGRLVLIASVRGHCLSFTFFTKNTMYIL